jgi:DegV family uncharacterized protein
VSALNRENTAVVLDSTADFPEARERFSNWRVVPLHLRFGDESCRDYVELGPEEFYAPEDLGSASHDLATHPGEFLAAYEDLGRYERIYSIHIAGKLSGTVESARRAADEAGGDRVRRSSGASSVERRTRRSRSWSATIDEMRGSSSRWTPRISREGRPHRPCAGAGRAAVEHQADPDDCGR